MSPRRPTLVRLHRWGGTAGGLLIAAWFASGIVMIWARMPALDPVERAARLPAIPVEAVRTTPARALQFNGGSADRLRLGTAAGRPIWRLEERGRWTAVWADVAERATLPTDIRAPEHELLLQRLAASWDCEVTRSTPLDRPDQWTLQLRHLLPMTRMRCAGHGARDLYVSHSLVDVVLQTTRRSRSLARMGPVTHWLYFTPLRRHGSIWLQVVLWLSVGATFLCVSGLWIGVAQWRRAGKVRRPTPHHGSLAWHHLLGLMAGPLALLWLISGALSLEPWGWPGASSPGLAQQRAFSGGTLRLEGVTTDGLREVLAKGPFVEGEILLFAGRPLWLGTPSESTAARGHESFLFGPGAFLDVDSTVQQEVILLGHGRLPAEAEMRSAARQALTGQTSTTTSMALLEERLDQYDAHYSDRTGRRPLPAVRYRLADRPAVALVVDPATGRALRFETPRGRLQRWIYLRLHTWDVPFLLSRPTLRAALLASALLFGLALTLTPIPVLAKRRKKPGRRATARRHDS